MKQDELDERRRGARAPWILREPVEREKTAAADRIPRQDHKPDPRDGEQRCDDAPHQPRAASNRRRWTIIPGVVGYFGALTTSFSQRDKSRSRPSFEP